jgi:hypothetical protein
MIFFGIFRIEYLDEKMIVNGFTIVVRTIVTLPFLRLLFDVGRIFFG